MSSHLAAGDVSASFEFAPPQSDTTSLQLLALNGSVQVTFAGRLSSDQYDELLTTTEQAIFTQQLSEDLIALGRKWGLLTTVRT
jgi:hypothetical protein